MSTMFSRRSLLIAPLALTATAVFVNAKQDLVIGLGYDALTRGPVPIPPSERGLQTVTAEVWFNVPGNGPVLEGAAFDPSGHLLFCNVANGDVLRLTTDRKLSTILHLESFGPGGLAIHNQEIFIAAMDQSRKVGMIASVRLDGTGLRTIVGAEAGFMPNDLVFDHAGGFYFTDFKGASTDPAGGTYYVSSDFSKITPVLPHLAMANGVALSPDGKELWITEFSRNLLHRVKLATATTISPSGTAIAYQFVGPAPDSMRADADGNLYVALFGQARVLVFNRSGLPIGQILLPGRDDGRNLALTSMAIRPGTSEIYILAADLNAGTATVFLSRAFAGALLP
ncbi:SMP-30/gluconolactonase/LRE family protein [Rhizobium leguminosarum]|uniref:SMP-30/gluconolactonase/LRE family protein n=1 Tax=Rhizobium leguminosarum TaxID=384 RepID=UPI0024B34EAF|nr:SMP-30/gluconolactonase/LRE family protein [Rhizobium leguminosarum]WHO82634.1 SMP-30/gluconolactonase/LRE family protein [Rhizobium leguminosarum]